MVRAALICKFAFVLALTSFALSAPAANLCVEVLNKSQKPASKMWRDESPAADWLSNVRLGMELKEASSAAGQKSFYDPQFRTRFYFSGGGEANLNGEIPVVDPKAKALFVFFHGSGTMNSSGKNFSAQFADLTKMGFAGLSLDLPYHGEGPKENRLADAKYFMKWLHDIISKYRNAGQPVILVGHSFGPEVVAEYVTRFPGDVNGALMISPAAFNPTLQKWYLQKTLKMKFGGDVPGNTLGGEWAEQVSAQFIWKTPGGQFDPTKADPNLKLTVLAGNWEEYVPGPIGGKNKTPIGPNTYNLKPAILKLISGANVVIENGVGHYIFAHRDASGLNVILREMMALVGYKPGDLKSLIDSQVYNGSLNSIMIRRYATDRVFRAWADLYYKGAFMQLMSLNNDVVARQAGVLFDAQLEARLRLIFDEIVATKETDPEFYETYRKTIEASKDLTTVIFPWAERQVELQAYDKSVVFSSITPEQLQELLKMKPQKKQSTNQ